MKRVLCLFPLILLLAACVPTPEEDVVVSKAEGRLDELIVDAGPLPVYRTEPPATVEPPVLPAGSPVPEQPARTLKSTIGAPDALKRSFSGRAIGDVLTVEIDAAVDVPNITRVPVFTVRIGLPEGEKRNGLLRYLLGEPPYYRPADEERLLLQNQIAYLTQYTDALATKPYGDEPPYAEIIDANLTAIQSMSLSLADLPAESTFIEVEPDPARISAELMNKDHVVVRLQQSSDGDAVLSLALCEQAVMLYTLHGMRAPQNGREQTALQAAQGFADGLGITDTRALGLICADEDRRLMWHSQTGVEDGVYRVSLAPVYAGIPCYSYTTYYGSDTGRSAANADPEYAYHPPQETVLATVQDGAVTQLIWQHPCEIVSMDNANVSLLTFDEIMELFQKQIFMNVYLDRGCPETMHITDIRFSYLRMKKRDAEEYYLLPVWDFLGFCTDRDADDLLSRTWYENQSFLTVNAIDGSIIDRNVGY